MKCYLGYDLEVGDKVLICSHHGRNAGASFDLGVVVGFTPKMVRYKQEGQSEAYKGDLIMPSKLVKLSIVKGV